MKTMTRNDERHSVLVPMLLSLSVATGIVDAVSYLKLGHVFVANMTGNIVFLGFAAAGAPMIDALASVLALAAFLVGTRIAALAFGRSTSSSEHIIGYVAAGEAVLLVTSTVIAATVPIGEGAAGRYGIAIVLALAMGMQNFVARKLSVPDITTTVLTMTITALAVGGAGTARRVAAIASMLLGAFIGGIFVLHLGVVSAFLIAAFALGGVAVASRIVPAYSHEVNPV